jgi:hypothetical protein
VVEHDLAKVGVEGSNPFARSRFSNIGKLDESPPDRRAFRFCGSDTLHAITATWTGAAAMSRMRVRALKVNILSTSGSDLRPRAASACTRIGRRLRRSAVIEWRLRDAEPVAAIYRYVLDDRQPLTVLRLNRDKTPVSRLCADRMRAGCQCGHQDRRRVVAGA